MICFAVYCLFRMCVVVFFGTNMLSVIYLHLLKTETEVYKQDLSPGDKVEVDVK